MATDCAAIPLLPKKRARVMVASGHAQRGGRISLSRDRLFRNRLGIGHVDSEMAGHDLPKRPGTAGRDTQLKLKSQILDDLQFFGYVDALLGLHLYQNFQNLGPFQIVGFS